MIEDSENNVAKEFSLGRTKIKICTDYCKNRTQDEICEILSDIARTAVYSLKETAYLESDKI